MNSRFSIWIDRIIYVGVLLSVILVPLVFNVRNQNIVILKPLLAEFIVFSLFGMWLINSLEKGEFVLPRTALNLPLVSYLIWIVCTILFSSMFWFYSIEEAGRYLAVFLLFFLVQKTLRNRSRLRWMFWILFGVCFVSTGWGMIQKLYNAGLINRPLVDWGREVLVSTFGNKNFFAGFLVLTTPVIFGYILAARKWIIKGILLVLFFAEFYILMATGTRTGFLGFWFGMTILVFLLIRFIWFGSQFQNMQRKKKIALYASILVALLLVSYFIIPGHLIDRLSGAVDLQQGTQRVRWIMWTGSTRATVDQPLSGHGHGTFQLVFPNYRPTMYHRFRVSHNTRHSHNEFLEVLMETGLVGLSLFLLLFVVLGIISYRFIKICRSRYYSYIVIGLISGLSAALAQNFASVNLRWMSSTFLFWLVIGLLFATIRVACFDSEKDETNNRRITGSYRYFPEFSWKTPIHGFIILVIGLVGYGFFRLIQADFYLKELNGMINVAERSQRVTWDETIETGKQSVRYNPRSLSSRYKLGFAFLQKGEHRRAYQQYDNLTDMAPNYAQIHNNIALIHRRFGDPYLSLLHFEWATALEDNVRNHLNLVQRYNQVGNENRALSHASSVPWIGNEDIRNLFHRIQTSNQPAITANIQSRKINDKREAIQQMNDFLRRGFSEKFSPLSNLLEVRRFVANSLKQTTLRRIMRLNQRNQSLNDMSILGIARQLRQQRAPQFRQFYTKMVRQWNRSNNSTPVLALSLGELLAQSGDTEEALEVIEPHRGQLTEYDIYRDSVEFIESSG